MSIQSKRVGNGEVQRGRSCVGMLKISEIRTASPYSTCCEIPNFGVITESKRIDAI